MTNGPPPAAAESSKTSEPGSASSYNPYSATIAASQTQQGGYQSTSLNSNQWANGATNPTATATTQTGGAYNYGAWPAMSWAGYPTTTSYGAGPSTSAQYSQHLNYQSYYTQAAQSQGLHRPPYSPVAQNVVATPKQEEREVKIPAKRKHRSPSPVPEPEPAPTLKTYRHWDGALNDFLEEAGLHETLKAFERDMLVLSSDWEEERIPKALQSLVKRLSGVVEYPRPDFGQGESMNVDEEPRIPLEERKLTYTKLADGELARTPTSINKSISQLLAKNRAKINASNRSEFLYSMSERQRHIQEASSSAPSASETTTSSDTTLPITIDPSLIGSCARTDAKTIDRDEQMKYDIAKNIKGPLSRTMKAAEAEQPEMSAEDQERVTAARYPALDERLKNVEAHFAVRYVPSPPRTLISRLKMLEDHIIKLEKEYPPWAALHFNQPNRGWPPPPRSTPIIVPVSMRSTGNFSPMATPDGQDTPSSLSKSVSFAPEPSESAPGSPSMSSAKQGQKARNSKSSLHRAVMEKLQVQQAMNEMGGAD